MSSIVASLHDTAEVFAEDGPLAETLEQYTVRSEQQEMAEAIAKALYSDESLVCEAGTGTGKTFAYLVPAILSGKKIIISTGTKHLQDQLFHKDLPVICHALGQPVKLALLKGRSNYLCQHRLIEYEKDGRFHSKKTHDELNRIRTWLSQTSSGDLSELTALPENSSVYPTVTSTAENCLGQECDYFEECFVFKARRRAVEATLVVVNHHLLLADLALRETGFGEVLPKAEVIIFDEAHQLPELAAEFFSSTLSSRRFLELLNDSRVACHNDAGDVPGLTEILDQLQTGIPKFRSLLSLNDARVAWNELNRDEKVIAGMQALTAAVNTLEQALDKLSVRSKALENCWRRAGELSAMLANFQERESEEFVQWVETRGHGFFLHQTPLDISAIFQQRLAQHECECIYTSATLAVGEDFSHFSAQLGLNDVAAHVWPSPFNYREQALLYLPEDMPDPREPVYTAAVINAALPVIKASRGHAFILFTSHRALQEGAKLIKGQTDYPVLVQGDAPRTELLETFRKTKHAILLGTSSFWEGVDVKGEALSCVIIDKLPFAPPDDPVFQARARKMEEQGINPFMDYQVPQAVITLKQGTGRLIRDSHDYGVLMICDPRLLSKPYGKKFLNSLPKMNVTRDIKDVESFYEARQTGN